MLKGLELKKDTDRICEQEQSVNAIELTQDEINSCVMKEDPEHLKENLNRMLNKLKVVKKQKEKELIDKKKNFERINKMNQKDNLARLRKDVVDLKEVTDQELKELERLAD